VQHPLALDAPPPRRAAPLGHLGHHRLGAERLVQVVDVAHLGRARVGLAHAAGSVTAGRSFSQMLSGDSSSPIVFPIDFDIFACPSSPMMRATA
jgi:hypothetical protein